MSLNSSIISVDKKSLIKLGKALEDLYPTNSKINNALASSMKVAAKPLQAELKKQIKDNLSKYKKIRRRLGYPVGKLQRSIRIFRSKRNTKSGRPSVYVGPLVKVPKSIKKKKGASNEEKRAASKAWVQKRSGFYFYMLEYGFTTRGGKFRKGFGLLPKTVANAGHRAESLIIRSIEKTIDKRVMKLLGTKTT